MKFSVPIPTRNRLKYLRYAISSIQKQDYDQWEIIVSDNDSHEPIAEYIERLNDKRIKYFRTEKFVSVTENWNNALNRCSGDYVIMLGDDDILLKNYFSKMRELIKTSSQDVDLVYANAYIYIYPGVIPELPNGNLQSCGYFDIFGKASAPFYLAKEMAMHLLEGHLNFNAYFGTNMQYALIKNSLIQKLKVDGSFFHSPYPDVYAMFVMLLEAANILVYPKESVVIGMTPKSTGNYLANNHENDAMGFLNVSGELKGPASLSSTLLSGPSSPSLNAWLISMERVKKYFDGKQDFSVNYNQYRSSQIHYVLDRYFKNSISKGQLVEFFNMLPAKQKWTHFLPMFTKRFLKKKCPPLVKKTLQKIRANLVPPKHAVSSVSKPMDNFSNIFEVFEQYEAETLFSQKEIKAILEEAQMGLSPDEMRMFYGVQPDTLSVWKRKFEKPDLARL